MAEQPSLKRVPSLPVLVLYGLGVTVGAGIYALIGEEASSSGAHAPVSFLAASEAPLPLLFERSTGWSPATTLLTDAGLNDAIGKAIEKIILALK